MDLNELKKILSGLSDEQISITKHAHNRIQDKRRKINYNKVISLIKNQKGLYKFEEQRARKKGEKKLKMWFRLNHIFDMNIYVAIKIFKEKGLNRLEIISAHKVKRKIQKEIKDANKN